ncbi:uncharacterized protein LOC107040377 [Diachasma alloeum]|uniref:uncharacterized protein LOC107040377 n=1 Tax=Diachasma alloeum TaxID=454923 RepID=UPI0007384925|nr:uncharacterized protein LOC107040377 [Diachasma alloeum]
MSENRYVKIYRTLLETYRRNRGRETILYFRQASAVVNKQKRYDLPSGLGARSEVGAILITGKEGNVPQNVEFRVYPRDSMQCQKMHKLSRFAEQMLFPLLFPNGQDGFSIYMDNNSPMNDRRVTVVQYFGWQLRIPKNNEFNPFIMGGRLTQQYILYGYIVNEWNRLNNLRSNPQQFRRDTLQGLIDHVEQSTLNTSDHIRLGQAMILPSSFDGGPRAKHQHYQDAMAMSREIGRPDLFITLTANPKWDEIVNFLRMLPAGYTPSDIPYFVCRVFYMKLCQFIDEIKSGKIFGKVLCYTCTIEFQKRGLPHGHLIWVLCKRNKMLTPEVIDKFISAEIPDGKKYPKLHELVMKHMLHGPHSNKTPCWNAEKKKCSKKFPKKFTPDTKIETDGFPVYKRPDNRSKCYTYTRKLNNKLILVDNSMVVPYNPYLLGKYGCHINVEYCGSVMAIKYLYKYINKPHDRVKVQIESRGINEIDDYIDSRYVSSMEAAWRLLELPTRLMSHSVTRLPVHLPGHQYIRFEEGHKETAMNSNQSITKLTAFFDLNSTEELAREYTYLQIPKHFTWNQKNHCWQKRKRGTDKTITRMYSVSPKDVERFFLKILLLHRKGATSFEALRTAGDKICSTFHEAAYELGFINNPKHIEEMMEECCATMMPKPLRKFFAYLLLTCDNIDVRGLWNKYKEFLCDQFTERDTLIEIERLLNSEDKSLLLFGFEEKDLESSFDEFEDDRTVTEHSLLANEMKTKLNSDQLRVFMDITNSLENGMEKLYFVDGPGGTGKTFLYKCLYHHWRSLGKNIVSIAWTGIAAILLPNGRTAHRFFKLPINLPEIDDEITPIFLTKRAKINLTNGDIIIWDEASMIPGVVLKMIDVTLKDLMKSEKLFGDKCFLFGGDFRQILPIVKRAGRKEIVAACATKLSFWNSMRNYTLRQNMRIDGEQLNKGLLDIGDGNIDKVEIPENILSNNIVKELYRNNSEENHLAECTLLAALNIQVDMLNDQVLEKFPGEIIELMGHDVATACDTDETDGDDIMLRFQPEYLNK